MAHHTGHRVQQTHGVHNSYAHREQRNLSEMMPAHPRGLEQQAGAMALPTEVPHQDPQLHKASPRAGHLPVLGQGQGQL